MLIPSPSAVAAERRADTRAAEAAAKRVLRECGVEKPPIDPVAIARKQGVAVHFVEFTDGRDLSGFYDADENAIYVNRADSPVRQAFTVAHELGHKLLHAAWASSDRYKVFPRDVGANDMDAFEEEATAFANALLVPTEMLAHYAGVASVSQLADLFLVSPPVIRQRIDSGAGRG